MTVMSRNGETHIYTIKEKRRKTEIHVALQILENTFELTFLHAVRSETDLII